MLQEKGGAMAETDGFKLPGSSYEELLKIVTAWGHMTSATSNDEVARLVGVDITTISRNNGFLENIGMIEAEGRKKSPHQPGRRAARAIEHSHDEELTRCWRDAVSNSKFMRDTVSAVRIRHGMDDAGLERHIGFNAGQPSNAKTRTGIRTVIQVLEQSGMLALEGDKYVPSSDPTHTEVDNEEPPATAEPRHQPGSSWSKLLTTPITSTRTRPNSSVVEVRINVELSVTLQELPALGDAILELQNRLDPNSRRPAGDEISGESK